MAKKKKIIIFTAVFLIAGLIIGFVCCYFFVPINPAISRKVTMATKFDVLINDQRDGALSQMRPLPIIKNDKLSFKDKLCFWSLYAKCRPVYYHVDAENYMIGGSCPRLLTFRFYKGEYEDNNHVGEFFIVPPDDRNDYLKGETHFDATFWDYKTKRYSRRGFCLEMDFEEIIDKYSERVVPFKPVSR